MPNNRKLAEGDTTAFPEIRAMTSEQVLGWLQGKLTQIEQQLLDYTTQLIEQEIRTGDPNDPSVAATREHVRVMTEVTHRLYAEMERRRA